MAPSELRDQTLREMRKALLAMMSPQWDLALEGRSDREVTEAARALLSLQRNRLRLRNAQLGEIRDQLIAHEGELVSGMKSMSKALKNLDDVEAVVAATTAVLKVVASVVRGL